MAYVIYNKETTKILQARARSVGCYITSYKSEAAAKAALTRLDKKGLLGEDIQQVKNGKYPSGIDRFDTIRTPYVKEDFAIAEAREFYANIEKKVTRHDAMTGEAFEESINTPYQSSRASEHYYCS